MRRGWVAATILVACASSAVPAEAGSKRTSSLSWTRLDGAESCIAPRDLAREVERRLGRAVFVSAADADVTVEGRVEAHEAGFHATVRLLDAEGNALGTRELESVDATCAELGPTLSLAMALMIDPDAGTEAPPAPARAQLSVRAPRRGRDEGTGEAARRNQSRMRVDAGPALSAGLVPGAVAAGVALRWMFDIDSVPAFEFSGAYWPERDVAHSLDLELVYGGVALCPVTFLIGQHLRLYPCAGADVGWLHAETGLAEVRVLPLVGGRAALRLAGPLVATAGANAMFPLNQRDLRTRSGSYEPSSVAAIADLGIGIEVP